MSKDNVLSKLVKHPAATGLSLWVNVPLDRDFPQPYITIRKQYKEKDGKEWKDTDFLREQDLFALPLLCSEALKAAAQLREEFRAKKEASGDSPTSQDVLPPNLAQDDIPL